MAPTITTANAPRHPSTSPSKKVMIRSQPDKLGTQRSGNATCAGQVLTFTRSHPFVLVCVQTSDSADTGCVLHARWTQKFHHQWAVAHSVTVRVVRLHLASRVQTRMGTNARASGVLIRMGTNVHASRVQIRMGTSVRLSQVQNHENISMQRQIVLRSAVDPNLKRPAPNTTGNG